MRVLLDHPGYKFDEDDSKTKDQTPPKLRDLCRNRFRQWMAALGQVEPEVATFASSDLRDMYYLVTERMHNQIDQFDMQVEDIFTEALRAIKEDGKTEKELTSSVNHAVLAAATHHLHKMRVEARRAINLIQLESGAPNPKIIDLPEPDPS